MILTVMERANLLNILPKEGNFATLRTVRKLRENVGLHEDEMKKWEVKVSPDGKIEWRVADDEGNPISQEADVEISEQGVDIIKAALRLLDEKKALKEEHFTLYEKFVG